MKYEDIKPVHQVTAKCETIISPRTETIIPRVVNKENNFCYGLTADNNFKGVLVVSSLVNLLRNVIMMRAVNVGDKVSYEGKEVLVICAPVTSIN